MVDGQRWAMQEMMHSVSLHQCRPLLFAEPFVGMGGARAWMNISNVACSSVNVFDTDARLKGYYNGLVKLGHAKAEDVKEMKFGPSGDMMKVNLKKDGLKPADAMIIGAPCTAFCGNGEKLGALSKKSKPFKVVLKWAIHLAWNGGLLVIGIENSPLIASELGGRESFVSYVMKVLTAGIPFFAFDFVFSELSELGLPHNRRRCWVRGLRRDLLPEIEIPPPMTTCFPKVRLEEILDFMLPNDVVQGVRLKTIKRYEIQVKEDINFGKAGRIACIDLHRKFGKEYPIVLRYDCIPPLKRNCVSLFLLSTHDIGAPWKERKLCRSLSMQEMVQLQGHPPEISEAISSMKLAASMTGGGFAVPMVASVMGPLLLRVQGVVKESGVELLSHKELQALAPDKKRKAKSLRKPAKRAKLKKN